MIVGDGKDPSNVNDFNLNPSGNMVHFLNYLYAVITGTKFPPAGDTEYFYATRRVAAHVISHQHSWPVTIHNCGWRDLDELRTNIRYYGPSCTDADLDLAVGTFGQVMPAWGIFTSVFDDATSSTTP